MSAESPFGNIIIADPPLNPHSFAAFSRTFERHGRRQQTLIEALQNHGVTPKTHPQVCDLCSGEGYIATKLTRHGWNAEGIVCIDRYRPRTTNGYNWQFMDLKELAHLIKHRKSMPPEAIQLWERFNLVTVAYGIGDEELSQLASFLTHPGGLFYSVPFLPFPMAEDIWEKIDDCICQKKEPM